MKKIYYQCMLKQTAPLRLSNGESLQTDHDLMLDGEGKPFIPGSAIAGVLRSMLNEQEANLIFGWIEKTQNRKTIAHESLIQTSDGMLLEEERKKIHLTVRHGVAINDEGVAEDEKKYDFNVVETDGTYLCVLELTIPEGMNKEPEEILNRLMEEITAKGIAFGARTTRGYGSMSLSARKREFDFGNQAEQKNEKCLQEAKEWLKFDPFSVTKFGGAEIEPQALFESEDQRTYLVKLQMDGSFSVRVYSSNPGKADYEPMKSMKKKPVIPGSSWAGVFRHHMRLLAQETGMTADCLDKIDLAFGKTNDEHLQQKSRISFSETIIEGGKELTVTRNALDRYTMKPRQRALFFSGIWYGGTGTLKIQIKGQVEKWITDLLEATLLDLHFGLLNFGGEGNVGRGRAKILEIQADGNAIDKLLDIPIGEGVSA